MGDRTAVQVIVYDCPPEQVGAVLDVIEEYGLTEDWGYVPRRPEPLALGKTYGNNEVSCGSADEIAGALAGNAPGASWETWEDPKYEWLGSVARYTPDLGMFSAECDSNGEPQFAGSWVIERYKLDELNDSILGLTWREALDALRDENKGRTLARLDDETED